MRHVNGSSKGASHDCVVGVEVEPAFGITTNALCDTPGLFLSPTRYILGKNRGSIAGTEFIKSNLLHAITIKLNHPNTVHP